jgi:hypothetical protein
LQDDSTMPRSITEEPLLASPRPKPENLIASETRLAPRPASRPSGFTRSIQRTFETENTRPAALVTKLQFTLKSSSPLVE